MSPTPNFVFSTSSSSQAKEGWVALRLESIGMVEEDELEVFVDALDDMSGPTSSSPSGVLEDRGRTFLPPNSLHPHHSQSNVSVESFLLEGEVHIETSKVTSARGMKSVVWKNTQQNSKVVFNFNLWRSFSMSSSEDTSEQGSGNILPSFASSA